LAAIQLVVGLGNPGAQYEQTRHNAGFWFVDAVARDCGALFRSENKYRSEVARCSIAGHDCRLQKPLDFMNRSGVFLGCFLVGSSRVDLQACKLEYSIVSPK